MIIGATLGIGINRFVDRFGYIRRCRSPFSMRSLGVVFFTAIGTAALYGLETNRQFLLPAGLPPESAETALCRFAVHIIFAVFLLTATLTDFDDMVISDIITVPGTLLALIFAALLPQTALPVTEILWMPDSLFPKYSSLSVPMNLWSPNPAGETHSAAAAVTMIALWWFWCFAMLNRIWRSQLPLRKSFLLFCRYLYRSPRTKFFVLAAVVLPIGFLLPVNRLALLSALTGMTAGMVLIWGFRLIARGVLGFEAMGFGDVTLMGMIGAFLGWQPCLLIVFTAPFAGLIYGIIHALLGKGTALPYGPFLCLAAMVLTVLWGAVWQCTAEWFSLGILNIGLAMSVIFILFGVLLYVVHRMMLTLRFLLK
jgi:prepilin signal peptidase PulO-like enzyme (type II secretory pathway)